MADEQSELRRINWHELFSFPRIFRSFRMAIHPSKLLLALAAIVLIYAGGWLLDRVWSLWGGYVDQDEIYCHFANTAMADRGPDGPKNLMTFRQWKDSKNENRLREAVQCQAEAKQQARTLDQYLTSLRGVTGGGDLVATFEKLRAEEEKKESTKESIDPASMYEEAKKNQDSWSSRLSAASDEFKREVKRIEKLIDDSYDQTRNDIDKKELSKDDKDKTRKALEKHHQLALQKLTERKVEFKKEVMAIRGSPVFDSFLQYEWACVTNAISAVRHGNITGCLKEFREQSRTGAVQAMAVGTNQTVPVPAAGPGVQPGFLYWVLLAAEGFSWLIGQHWVYALIFLVWCLAVWALFGGAIHRIAALHAAREEKISITQALRFSAGKFLSFFTAPLIPIAIVLVLGVFLVIGGLVGNIMGFGAILMGVLFFLAIVVGLLIAFLLVGLVAGAGLMYPTIAVEGSDSFDAISRSFSYVFARPWRAAMYSMVALFYGVICYLFVRLFAFLALAGTHMFVKWGVFTGGNSLSAEADKLDVMWTAPTFDSLHGPWSWSAMTACETIGAAFIWIYVFIIAGLVAAFLLSYLASSTTVIYYLLRQKVDATDLDDVYVEEAEAAPAPPAAEPVAEAPPADKPVEAAPAPEPPKPAEPGAEKPQG